MFRKKKKKDCNGPNARQLQTEINNIFFFFFWFTGQPVKRSENAKNIQQIRGLLFLKKKKCILQMLSQSFCHSLPFQLCTKGQSGYKHVSWQKGNMNAVGWSLLIGMQGNASRETEFYSCLHTVFIDVSYYLLILNCPDDSFMHSKSMFMWFFVPFKILNRALEDMPQPTTSRTTWHPGCQRESYFEREEGWWCVSATVKCAQHLQHISQHEPWIKQPQATLSIFSTYYHNC